jgi:sugar transferase (PEP-CTERM/EpsH1 system associated)
MNGMNQLPLVVHLIYRLDFGGLETLLAESINRMPVEKYRHAIVCLTDYSAFSKKITRPDVEIFALHKPPGLGLETHYAIWKLFRRIRPTILHTYNISALEYAAVATLAGVPVRIHAEHGRDASDPDGTNWKYNLLRRLLVPFIDKVVPVSGDLKRWFNETIGVADAKNFLINNGVDTSQFSVARNNNAGHKNHFPENCFVIGTVGRIQDVKNHAGLIDAFIALRESQVEKKEYLRLIIIGDGPLLAALKTKVIEAGIGDYVWLPGARNDIASLMQSFSVFAMTSIAEGTPVVVLEAMASGLPVVATKVGGMPEVVIDNLTGKIVPVSDPQAFAAAVSEYLSAPERLLQHGTAGRKRIEDTYSIDAMLDAYTALYDELCAAKT